MSWTASATRTQTSLASATRPIAVDLFAGAGGFALGFEQAGFDVVTAIEYDAVHAVAHQFNFPRTKVLCANASTLTVSQLSAAVKMGAQAHGHTTFEVDVVFGGPPCQGFSAGGKRAPHDERNLLIFDFLRLTAALRPRYFVLENVPPLKNHPDPDHPDTKLIDRLIDWFEGEGYIVETPKILNASRYGVPQDRRRLILLGSREGEPLATYPQPAVLPVPKRPFGRPRPWEEGGDKADVLLPLGPTVWDAIRDLPNIDSFHELVVSDEVELNFEMLAEQEKQASDYVKRLRGLAADVDDFSYPREWNRSLLSASRRTAHSLSTVERFANTKPGHAESTSRFYRLHAEGLCSTLRAGTGYERGSFMAPRPIHPCVDRVISVREAARLHSFPDWFRFHYSKWHGFRQIGNSLPPLLGRAIAVELVRSMGLPLVRPTETLKLGDPNLLKLATSDAADYFGADLGSIPTHKLRHRPKKRQAGDGEEQAVAA